MRNDSGLASFIEAAQISTLFSRARFVYAINIVNSIIVAAFLWNVVAVSALLTWLLAVIGITAVRFYLLLKYDRDESKNAHLDCWKRTSLWGAAFSGASWGIAAIFVFPHASLPHQLFLLVVILGMMAGSMASWHAYFPSFQAFFLPTALLTSIRIALEILPGSEDRAMFAALGAMFLLFSTGLFIFARQSNQLLSRLYITQYKKRVSDERYRALFLGAKVPMLLIDSMNGRIVDANAASESYYGYPQGQIREMNIGQINMLDSEEIAKAILDASHEKNTFFHFRHRLANNEVRDVEVHSGPINMGHHQLLYSIVNDITERKQIEQELQREVAKTRMLFKAAGDGLHIMNHHGDLIEASESFYRMLGYTREEMRGMNVLQWDAQFAPDTRFEERVNDIPEEGRMLETRHRCKDGRVIDVEIHVTIGFIQGERFVYASSRDITQRKKTEKMLREREAHLHAILDNMPHMLWLKDKDGRYLALNRQLAHTTVLKEPSAVLGKTDYDLWPRELAEKYRADDVEVMRTQRQKFVEEQALDHDRVYWSETFKTPILDENGNVLGTTGYARDITDRKLAEESQQLAASIYQSSNEAISVTDENNLIVDINPAFTRITGYTLEEVVGKNPKMMKSGRHNKEFYREMWQEIESRGHWQGEMWDRRKNGELFAKWNNISVIRHQDGSIYRYVSQFSDITEKKQKDELIWRQANFDTLTKLPNRRLFHDRLDREIKKSRRSGKPLALLFIDLDRFKEVNDTMGHDMGDRLLVEAALRIGQCVRETDTVARLGGDEFTVILPEIGSRAPLDRIAQKIINELCKPFILGVGTANISASIGITLYPDDAADLESLLRNADQAMYESKARGRNCFGYFTEIMQNTSQEKPAHYQ